MKLKYGTEYKLNTEEQELITNMSNKICNQGRTYFKSKYKIDRKMDLNQMNLNGFGAELAFCKLCNIPFDNTTNQYENHFNKVDATLKNGKTVDIKNKESENNHKLQPRKTILENYVRMKWY